jgi:hypothetical protein
MASKHATCAGFVTDMHRLGKNLLLGLYPL